MTSTELKQQRAAIVADMNTLYQTAKAANRSYTAEEQEQWTQWEETEAKLKGDIVTAERGEKLEYLDAELKQTAGRKTAPVAARSTTRGELDRTQAGEFLRSWAMAGAPGHRPDADTAYRAAEYGFDLSGQVLSYRALSKGTNSAGGYTVPQSFSTEIEKILAYYFPVQSAFDVFETADSHDYPWPTVTDVANSSGIVAEAGAIGSSSDPTFGQITFKAWDYFSPVVKVSYQLLRDSARDIPSLLAELFAERMGRALDTAVVSANAGTAAPEGILNGVTASVNLASGNAITVAKLLALETSVDPAYRNLPGTGFVMHDGTWQAIRALADTTGRLMVNTDLQNGIEKKLLGYPVFISNSMTSIDSPGDNAPLVLFGALKKYKVRRIGGSTLTRLNELYAGNGQVGFCLHEAYDARWLTKNGVRTLNSYDAA